MISLFGLQKTASRQYLGGFYGIIYPMNIILSIFHRAHGLRVFKERLSGMALIFGRKRCETRKRAGISHGCRGFMI
jgi:hypothetical protein